MKPEILPPAIGKYKCRLGFLTLVSQPNEEKENSEFKPKSFSDQLVKLRLEFLQISFYH